MARFDDRLQEWRELGRVEADDRMDALEQWALSQGGFEELESGFYGARRAGREGPWYLRLRRP